MGHTKIPNTHTLSSSTSMIRRLDQWFEKENHWEKNNARKKQMLPAKLLSGNWPISYGAYEYTHDWKEKNSD
jgi:hypothetical protein